MEISKGTKTTIVVVILLAVVVIVGYFAYKHYSEKKAHKQHVTAPVAPIAPPDTVGVFAAKAHADSVAVAKADSLAESAYSDSLWNAENSYKNDLEAKLAWGKNASASDSTVAYDRVYYEALLKRGETWGYEKDDVIIALEKIIYPAKGKKGGSTKSTATNTGTAASASTPKKATAPANFKVEKTIPHNGYTTSWRKWSSVFPWTVMKSNENVVKDFTANLKSIADESQDFTGCTPQIPCASKDPLIYKRKMDSQTKGDTTYVRYVPINNYVWGKNCITSGGISGGTKGKKEQHFDAAVIDIRITAVADDLGRLTKTDIVYSKLYSVQYTREQAQQANFPTKFTPPVGRTLVVDILFFGDGYGGTPACNNMLWRTYFK